MYIYVYIYIYIYIYIHIYIYIEREARRGGIRVVVRSGPNLEPGTVAIYGMNGSQNCLTITRKVGPRPGTGEGGR